MNEEGTEDGERMPSWKQRVWNRQRNGLERQGGQQEDTKNQAFQRLFHNGKHSEK